LAVKDDRPKGDRSAFKVSTPKASKQCWQNTKRCRIGGILCIGYIGARKSMDFWI